METLFKADTWYLSPIIKSELSDKHWNFRKLLSSKFLVFNDSSDKIDGDINECDFSVLYNEMCQYLQGLENLMNKNFPNDEWKPVQNHAWVKCSFKIQDRTVEFNVTV